MTTRPASASDIRYAVMSTSSSFCAHCSRQCGEQLGLLHWHLQWRIQYAADRRGGDLWGANLIPWLQGPRAAVAQATPRAGTFRIPANSFDLGVPDGGALTTLRRTGGEWRRDVRPPSDSKIPKKKPAADFSARASIISR
jgi:hypothetical protein